MTKTEQLIQRAAQIAGVETFAISGWRTDIRDHKILAASDLETRLAAYQEATKDEDPPCPDCWIERGQQLAMAPITSDTPDENQYGCMECGFEVSFPAQTVRSRTRVSSAKSARRAA